MVEVSRESLDLPGRAGAGEVIYSIDGKRVDRFSWGLEHKTNNHVEILALLKVC